MDGTSLLSGGVDTLREIKENLLELERCQSESNMLNGEEKRLEKSIQGLEKDIAEEIQSTIKKRRQEIETAFDKQIDKIQSRVKKIQDRRDKSKNAKVSERIKDETSSLRADKQSLRLDAKTLIKQKHIPSLCNTKLYYALYFPGCFTDFLVILSTLLFVLLVIPCGIYFFLLPEEKSIYLIIIYIITVILFGGIYILLGNLTKERHREELLQIRVIRGKIRKNKKVIATIKRNIKKDKDESTYGLQNFDEEIAKAKQEISEIEAQKKEALYTFDNTTNKIIADEVNGIYEEKLNGLKVEFDRVKSELINSENKIKALTIKMASEYDPFIGKDLMLPDRLDALINIIQAGNATSISEAITVFRQMRSDT